MLLLDKPSAIVKERNIIFSGSITPAIDKSEYETQTINTRNVFFLIKCIKCLIGIRTKICNIFLINKVQTAFF